LDRSGGTLRSGIELTREATMPIPSGEFLQAVAHYKRGQLTEAERLCASIIKADLNNFEARHLLGVILIARGDARGAERELALAVAGLPGSAPAQRNRGVALARLGRFNEALASFDKAIALKADDIEALVARGNACLALTRPEEAVSAFDKALALKPGHPLAWRYRGVALIALRRFEAAVESCSHAIALKPDYAEALSDRGAALCELKRLEEAAASYDSALAHKADDAEILSNRGVVRHELDDIEGALSDFDRAIALRPDFALASSNRGNALQALKRPIEALASYDRAIALDPDLHDAFFHRGMCKLSLGRFKEGWGDYEHGRRSKKYASPPPAITAPDWSGEDLKERSILIFAEQGQGDVFQLCRYLPLLAARGADVTFLVQERLHRVLSTLKGGVRLRSVIDPSERFDFQLPLMSLPGRFETELDSIPFSSSPYLSAQTERAAQWRARLEGQGFKVGVCWQGGLWQGGAALRGRSFEPKEFEPLARVSGVRLISLQKQHGPEQLGALPGGMRIESIGEDFDAGPDGFVDTAAVMEELDLIVTCDTSIAHLAGALGRPAWVALRYAADWRWLIDRDDSPWYATLRLFRQKKRNEWVSVFSEMASELQLLIKNRKTN
jgi:tetratricopeptide (TPR) repeat protein